jgi:hypothetical protein
MKGFIHVIEIIVISILVLFAFTQFTSTPTLDTDWTKSTLILQGNDVLHSLDEKGIDWLNSVQVETELSDVLPGGVVYNVILINETSEIIPIINNPVPSDSVSLSIYKYIHGDIYEVILSMGYIF